MIRSLPLALRILHWVIIINFVVQIAYGGYQTFTVFAPPGTSGPLFGAAHLLSHEHMVVRRMYANETWLAIVGCSLYVAITVFLPKLLADLRSET